MSEYIVHTALMQDCFNLLLKTSWLCPDFQYAIKKERAFGEAASTTKSGDVYTWRIMEDLRLRWTEQNACELASLLAFVLGWVSHRAADRQMKPVFRAAVDPETKKSVGNDCTLYNEAEILRTYYLDQSDNPYKDTFDLLNNTFSFSGVDLISMQKLFHGMLQMAFMRMHTIKPALDYDIAGIKKWIGKIYDLLQEFKINLELEATILVNPDPEKYKKYILDTNFFNHNDPLIHAAKAIRKKENISEKEVECAIDAPQTSDYAIALQTALRYVRACNDYFSYALTLDELKKQLNIGELGSDGLWV